MAEERVQKLLAQAGVASRRQAEALIEEGRVTVNGQVVTLGDKAEPTDAIKVDGKRIHLPERSTYLLVNKPRGFITSTSDPEGRPTVMELIPERWRDRLRPVGRLDFQTEGLLLMTDDGDFAQQIAHPRHGCTKTYEAKVQGRPDAREIAKLRRGIVLEGKKTRPASVSFMRATSARGKGREAGDNTWWRVGLKEGRTRQIREMFFRIGHPVRKLRRTAIGSLRDTRLPLGKWRELTEAEIEALRGGGRRRRK